MSKVIVDDVLGSKLGAYATTVELCDQSGRLLGHFVPVSREETISQPEDGCPYTEAELRAAIDERGGRTLAEIWKSLTRE
jgi:hypothetical protein